MHWYLIYTKPKQERRAFDNLQLQGYQCYLPTIPREKLRQGLLTTVDDPLFSRYLFICLDRGDSFKSWAPIRSTKGVVRLVSFGIDPVRVDDGLIEYLRIQEAAVQAEPIKLFKSGDPVTIVEPPFRGIEGIYQMTDGGARAMVLIEILNKPLLVSVASANMRSAG